MLNISEELLKFGSIDMENLEQKIGRIPDDMKQAIELYNKALDDIVNKNEDIAIIALKKAISIYPAFYEAMNLMGICYLSLNEEENARIMFNKVIKMDNNSIRALNYLEELDGNTVPEGGKSKPVKVRKTNRAKTSSGESPSLVSWLRRGLALEHSQPYFIKYIVGFIIGVLVMCLVWLFTPSDKPIVFNLSKPINESLQMTELKNENADLAGRLDEATNALQKAKDTEKQLQDQMDQYAKWSAILRDLQNLADDGKYMEAVNEIEKNLAGLELPKEIEAEVIALNNECKPKAVQQFYDAAKKIYNANAQAKDPEAYKKSADYYKVAIRIIEDLELKPSNINEIYYYGGKAIALSQSPSKQEGDTEAIRCFKTVVISAPGSKLASYSQARINELEAGKTIRH